jgi:hypothetical protein
MPTNSKFPPSIAEEKPKLTGLPLELQVQLLTYLRAYDLAAVQQTCKFFSNPILIDAIVRKFHHVYDFGDGKKEATNVPQEEVPLRQYEELRNLEIRAVARALNRPEPAHGRGYFVSKSWCKQALKWLEAVQIDTAPKQHLKAVSKKKQRLIQRRSTDASPPWPNANVDLLCGHQNLASLNSKSSRARRKLLDKQAWKILKKLYPDSSELESCVGECLQCTLEKETIKKNKETNDQTQAAERKQCLADTVIRRFYTRTKGVPAQAMRQDASSRCPLEDGTYVILERAWCHGWRKYVKTGCSDSMEAPDAAGLLCYEHGLPLMPPHLESYLEGHSNVLFDTLTTGCEVGSSLMNAHVAAAAAVVPNLELDAAIVDALRAAGLGPQEVEMQVAAMRNLERVQRPAAPVLSAAMMQSKNAVLDRENHAVVEILTQEEFHALEKLWPHSSCFTLILTVQKGQHSLETQPCRECDATGMSNGSKIKDRRKRWDKKTTPKPSRGRAKLEY